MVEKLYRAVASRYGIETILDTPNVSFYAIASGESILEQQQILNQALHEIVVKNTNSEVFAFYVDNSTFKIPTENLFFTLGIRKDMLPKTLEDIPLFTEMIVLHELSHLIEQQNLGGQLEIELNDCDKAIGLKIEKRAASMQEDLTHNNQFGAILSNLIRRQNQNNPQNALRAAMSKTLQDIEDAILNGEIDESFYQC
ncbi:hypothetical protein P0R33_06215 [Flavobacterium sp. YJ01]|uniref:hypothetical protein n=1 Tax=Flavobacterium sp. YJ01 TaxID=3031997 RepID=UPI0023E3E5D4|nr:hypothetical protein [Flavobacterium sp. YJ01]WET03928.1 hypothetical protein P0R33_06215 [Flavobacterium sp. YJ01]